MAHPPRAGLSGQHYILLTYVNGIIAENPALQPLLVGIEGFAKPDTFADAA
jgi:hypothetical protein